MQIITETKRLYLREFSPKDAIHLYKMNLDKDVIRYTGDVAFKSESEAAAFISNYDQYKNYNMGRWTVCNKKTHDFLGWCGLKYHSKKRIIEVGFRFYKKYWKKGYATESTKAAINYGFNKLKIKTIHAHAHIKNIASHHVIEKSGLHFISKKECNGIPIKWYRIENKSINIKLISPEATHSVRHPVLRAGRPIKDCIFEGDNLNSTFHLGLFFNKKLVGVATLLKNKNVLFDEQLQYQLRGMAILKEEQKHGFGHLLLKEAEHSLTNKNVDRVWFNAREVATNFYKKNNYKSVGKPFEVPNIGLHYIMTKKIN